MRFLPHLALRLRRNLCRHFRRQFARWRMHCTFHFWEILPAAQSMHISPAVFGIVPAAHISHAVFAVLGISPVPQSTQAFAETICPPLHALQIPFWEILPAAQFTQASPAPFGVVPAAQISQVSSALRYSPAAQFCGTQAELSVFAISPAAQDNTHAVLFAFATMLGVAVQSMHISPAAFGASSPEQEITQAVFAASGTSFIPQSTQAFAETICSLLHALHIPFWEILPAAQFMQASPAPFGIVPAAHASQAVLPVLGISPAPQSVQTFAETNSLFSHALQFPFWEILPAAQSMQASPAPFGIVPAAHASQVSSALRYSPASQFCGTQAVFSMFGFSFAPHASQVLTLRKSLPVQIMGSHILPAESGRMPSAHISQVLAAFRISRSLSQSHLFAIVACAVVPAGHMHISAPGVKSPSHVVVSQLVLVFGVAGKAQFPSAAAVHNASAATLAASKAAAALAWSAISVTA